MNVRYALEEIRKHATDKQWWRKRFLTHVVGRYFTSIRRPPADPLASLAWDNVIVLDACRYDLFAEVFSEEPLPGTLDSRQSAQSGTPGYLAENFDDATFHDVVYVTANPYVETKLTDDTFHAVDHVWQDGWDEELQTVRPDVMRERALEAADRYPDKRLVIHFNQPHIPFVGEERIESRGIEALRDTAMGRERPAPTDRVATPFERLGTGELDRETVWQAYRSNLEVAWDDVERLLWELPGLTAVTSDHGNALGERAWPFPIRVYGHPLGVLIPALTEVPWLTHQNGERKDVIAASPRKTVDEHDDVEERLRMLGYAE